MTLQHGGWVSLELLVRDFRHAARSLLKSRGYSIVAVLLLTVAIGSNLAVFSVVDPLLLRALPVDRPDQLVRITSIDKEGRESVVQSPVVDMLRGESVFAGVCGFDRPQFPVDIRGVVQNRLLLTMTPDCFRTLGIRTRIGRTFTSPEGSASERVALLGYSFWQRSFGGTEAVLGQKINIAGYVFTIIGVMDERFTGFTPGSPIDLAIPLEQTPLNFVPTGPVRFWTDIFARRAPSVSVEMVQARIKTIERQLLDESVPRRFNEQQRQEYVGRTLVVRPAPNSVEGFVSRRFGSPLYVTMGMCALILAVTCVNLAILSLSRGLSRQKEIVMRLALGATRASAVRTLALESLLLVLISIPAAAIFAQLANQSVSDQARILQITVNPVSSSFLLEPRIAAFFAAMVLTTVIVLSMVPAWQAFHFHRRSLTNTVHGLAGASTRNQKALLCIQIALALVLVSMSGFLNASLRYVDGVRFGMNMQGLTMAMLSPLPGVPASPDEGAYYRKLLQEVETLPGVASAAISSYAPFYSGNYSQPVFMNDTAGKSVRAQSILVTDRFFETLGTPLVSGSAFQAGGTEADAIVSESVAEAFGGPEIIGRFILAGETGRERRVKVVGISANVQPSTQNPNETDPLFVYVNLRHQPPPRFPVLLTKGAGGAPVALADLRRVVDSQGRHYVETYRLVADQLDQSLVENRLLAHLSTAFGALSLFLAAAGLFGLLSQHVAMRRGEIGLRMALGADSRGIQRMILHQMQPVMGAGIAVGLIMTLLAGRAIAANVFGVSVYDARLIGLSIIVLIITGILAAWRPARRASLVDPLIALRHD
jgi:putative ABC transport system permease protein